ncbi:MAG: hypothetical protein LBH28_07345, partial [Oscillospiraceae bacterium]|nr:hypothetical protein [Oscillospiraceae bacterium]
MKTQIKEQSVAFNKHTKSLKVMLVIMLVISILASALTLLYHGGTYGKPEYSDSISGSIWVNGSKKSQLVDPNNANTGERELPADPTESVTNGGELPVESDVPDDVCPVAEPNNPVGSVKRPLPGYSVWLYDTGDLIQPITNTETDEDGSYCFENLVLGEYVVGIELKAVDDREDLRPMATANDKELFVNEDFDGPPMEFSEPENTDNISGFVWVKDDKSPVFSDTADDDNSKLSVDPDESVDGDIEASAEPDGMIDNDYESLIESDLTNDIGAPTEPDESDEGEMQPLPRYIVNLYDAGDLTRPIDATVTDENGSYRFDKLAPGKYVVGIALEAVDGNEGLIPMGTANGSIFTVNEDFTDPPMAFSDVIDIKADFDSDIAAAPSSDNTYADKPLTIYLAHDYDDPIANAVSVTNNANNGKSEPDCVQNAGVADTSVITDTHLYAGFTAPAANPLFTGWNTKADSSGISYNTGDLLIVDSDIIPYAQWIEDRSGDILKDVDYMENAYINGSQTAQNGAVNAYQPVNRNDTILYQLTINNKWIGSLIPPTIPNPNYFQPKAIPPAKINFINGGFEEPYIATSALLEGHYEFIHMSNVPGWSTEPVHAADQSKPNAYMIEIQQPLKLTWPGFISSGAKDQFPPNTADGSRQYAELNAEVEGILYQICQTVPGTKVYYEFYHGARGTVAGNNTDVMNFYLRAPGETGGLQRQCSDSYTQGSSTYVWGHYTGTYIVPAGQFQTEFAFESVSTTSGRKNMGNFLDDIRLYTNSYIELTVTNNAPGGKARIGDLVTY